VNVSWRVAVTSTALSYAVKRRLSGGGCAPVSARIRSCATGRWQGTRAVAGSVASFRGGSRRVSPSSRTWGVRSAAPDQLRWALGRHGKPRGPHD
jgi:hypothetical protein